MKKADPAHQVVVLERNAADDTFGWGVVFSDQTLGYLREADPPTAQRIEDEFAHWDDIDVHHRGAVITSGGHGFSGIARKTLLRILQDRAAELGVDLRFGSDVADDAELRGLGFGAPDLVVAADGVNSRIRGKYAEHFKPDLDVRKAPFCWLGTTKLFDAFTFLFVENEHGVFQAHAYRYSADHSAFIVECDERSWRGAGFDGMSEAETVAACERMFAPWLDGNPLESNAPHLRSPWIRFTRVTNEHWSHGRVVLIGDSAHTAHFSIGSGTKLALEDAIALARSLGNLSAKGEVRSDDVDGLRTSDFALRTALQSYQDERKTEA